MEYLYDLKEKLCKELEEYAQKSNMNAGDLEMVHKLTDTIKNVDKIMMLEEGGYSQAADMDSPSSYARGSSYTVLAGLLVLSIGLRSPRRWFQHWRGHFVIQSE